MKDRKKEKESERDKKRFLSKMFYLNQGKIKEESENFLQRRP